MNSFLREAARRSIRVISLFVSASLVVAFLMGALAHRLKVSSIAGYLLAGVIVGPFTPGFVADAGLANQLAEIGVILLMFGVGLHSSLRDLLSVRNIANRKTCMNNRRLLTSQFGPLIGRLVGDLGG